MWICRDAGIDAVCVISVYEAITPEFLPSYLKAPTIAKTSTDCVC